jgi:hypothetical protein
MNVILLLALWPGLPQTILSADAIPALPHADQGDQSGGRPEPGLPFPETPNDPWKGSGQGVPPIYIFGGVCLALQLLFFAFLIFLVVRFLWNRGGPRRP